ncbi:hypothetical protein BO71DRAFT_388027 [Aspergillus ellipticus CBS 707.79]|uniref:Uncharacterized protein n=1 Tax=Aspergillus ellipticus CBS 707.79 TaxID=1448320 RepID=A0A319CYE6_9EURO|nr:hypothetical protein BO71DRAFT_388027 [Aspergillus ellipticus CBS 707.79]
MSSFSVPLSKSFQRKVDELVQKYDRISEPSPALRDFLRNPDELACLMNAVRRQVLLVQARSRDLEDAQITVYDGALLILSNHGDDPRDTGALELFLAEYLGLVPTFPASQVKQKIVHHGSLGSAPIRATESGHATERAMTTDERAHGKLEHAPVSRDDAPSRHHHGNDPTHLGFGSSSSDKHLRGQADRLIEVYRSAKNEYYGEKKRDGAEGLGLVRYLRDTAENTLLYLQGNGMSDHPLIPDIKYSFEMAKDKAAQLSGGRGRRFDEPLRDAGRHSHRHKRRRSCRDVDSYRPNGR